MSINVDENDVKEKLIRNLKKEVKQIMEEAVTRKFVHEESATITSLCGAIEMCLSHGLKKRTLGLFKTYSTTALIHKVGKSFEPAGIVSRKVQEIENQDPGRRSHSSGDSTSRISKPPLIKKHSGTVQPPKYLWIRIALFEKVLSKIVDHLVQNSNKYYEKEALTADPDYGNILSSLSVGPCALDYSRMKTIDHLWTDLPADELVQRHKISSGHLKGPTGTPPQPRRPGLHFWKPSGASSEDGGSLSMGSFAGGMPPPTSVTGRVVPSSAREYVESLHQNSRATLLYGKNNVYVQPKDHLESMPGYLSLHQASDNLIIKWSPNHLMNGCHEADNKSVYWEYALYVKVEEIVYVHCHQNRDSGGTIVLVGQDGTQYPPLHFPSGGHLLAFLSCLENGLLPNGQLDPPLWSQRGKGKVFPKLRRKARALVNGRSFRERPYPRPLQRQDEETEEEKSEECSNCKGEELWDQKQYSDDDETSDYVFRILTTVKPERFSHLDLMSPLLKGSNWFPRVPRLSSHSSSTSSTKSLSLGDSLSDAVAPPPTPNPACSAPTPTPTPSVSLDVQQNEENGISENALSEKNSDSLELLCSTMKQQIISRAFYGWLAHCRHLRTVRTHLAGLVLSSSLMPSTDDANDWKGSLTEQIWKNMENNGVVTRKDEIRTRSYFAGMDHSIRKEVWPYLLEHYEFGSTIEEREELDFKMRQMYEATMSEWLAVEAIVRQRDKETTARSLVKTSSGSQGADDVQDMDDKNIINDVFEQDTPSLSSNDNPTTVPEEDEEDSKMTLERPETSQSGNTEMQLSESETTSFMDAPMNHSKTISKESSYEDARSPTCVVTPDEGLSASQDLESETQYHSEYEDTAASNFNGSVCFAPVSSPKRMPDVTRAFTKVSLDSGNPSDIAEDPIVSAVDEEIAADDEVKSITHDNSVETDNTFSRTISDDKAAMDTLGVDDISDNYGETRSPCISPASSHGGIYSTELLDNFALNIHRIDKDVQRCDRHFWYFNQTNLEKLRNVMCTYVWEHMDTGYMQGMCDLAAPLLVIFDDEAMSYACFSRLMNRMANNFPHLGSAMDQHFANMRSLIQILDPDIFELMHQNGDYTHFYFCYRWFLLDFKREFVYDDVFLSWESIWSARYIASSHFNLFIALALVKYYRAIILENSMDFTDIIKFFNEMAERHEAAVILNCARNLVTQLQSLIENK